MQQEQKLQIGMTLRDIVAEYENLKMLELADKMISDFVDQILEDDQKEMLQNIINKLDIDEKRFWQDLALAFVSFGGMMSLAGEIK